MWLDDRMNAAWADGLQKGILAWLDATAGPGVGTGTILLGVLRRIAAAVTDDQGAGAVRGAIEAADKRIEIQVGPFASRSYN
jgi:hypothetical protein